MAAKGHLRLGLLFLGWALLLLWPVLLHPNQPLMAPGAQFSDLLISHWPNAEFLRQSLFTYRQFPLWNPSIINGAPFAADPLAGVWYLPNWLTVLLPLPFAFNLLLVLHLAWGGWGMYHWSRADGFGWLPSLVGGLAYAAMPKAIAHIAAGHISLVFAVAWMPWLLYSVEANNNAPTRRIALTALIWAMIFLADVRWGIYAGIVLVIWWLARQGWGRKALFGLLLCVITFVLLTPVLWLPLAEFVGVSSRIELTPADNSLFSLPPGNLVGLVLSGLGGSFEYTLYAGFLALALAIVGAVKSEDRVGKWTMIVLALLALWWALGPNAGLFAVLSRLPGLSLLRVPSRSLFLVALAICWLAVRGVAALESGWRIKGRGWNLALVGALAAVWVLAIGGSAVTAKFLSNLFIAAGTLTATVIILRTQKTNLLLPVFFALELLLINSTFLDTRPINRSPVAVWLSQQPGQWRVYSPSYSLSALDAVQLGLEQADGVNPLQLASVLTYMDDATGVPRTSYSITVPPLEGHPSTVNADARINAPALGNLNVRYVVSEFPVISANLALETQIGNTWIFSNVHDAGRVRGGALQSWTPNRITVTATGPNRVTLAEVWYPGWVATIDGAPVEIERDEIFRSVTVGEGNHTIVFEFRPTTIFIGLSLSLIGIVFVSFLLRRDA
jgi:hypothetical protein